MDTTTFNYHRHGPDRLVRAVTLIVLVSWILCCAGFLLVAFVRSPVGDYVYRDIRIQPSEVGGPGFMRVALMLMGVQAVMGVAGLVMRARRMKRSTDRFSAALFLFTIASFAGLIIYSRIF